MSFFNFRQLIIVLTLAWLTLFVLFPHLLLVLTSVLTPDAENLAVWPLNPDNYLKVLEPVYASVFWHSLRLSLLATLVSLIIAYPFAYLIAQYRLRTRIILLFFLVLPFWTNSLIRTYAIKILLGKQGVVNFVLQAIGVIDEPLQLLYTEFAVIFGLVYILLPFMVLPLYSNFDRLDHALIEAGRDLGANALQRFTHIILPLTMPGIVAGCLIVFLPAMGMFYVADLLGGARNLLLGNVIKNLFLVARDWPFGAAFSVMLIVLMALMLYLYYRANQFIQRKGGLDDQSL